MIEGIALVGWILLFATLLISMAVLITSRRRGQRRRDAAPRIVTRAATVPPGLNALHRADPDFDEQLLQDAALSATFLMFAATSTGDEAPIRRVVTDSFWETPFGLVTRTTARDRRRENAEAEKRAAQGLLESVAGTFPLTTIRRCPNSPQSSEAASSASASASRLLSCKRWFSPARGFCSWCRCHEFHIGNDLDRQDGRRADDQPSPGCRVLRCRQPTL